nr:hypothetical protein [Tanacetum cinerariifolium]
MAEVARRLEEDLGGKLEVEVALVEEEVGAGVGEVKGGGVVFEVSRILLGEILRDIMGKAMVKHLKLIEEPIDNRWVVREDDKEGTPVER